MSKSFQGRRTWVWLAVSAVVCLSSPLVEAKSVRAPISASVAAPDAAPVAVRTVEGIHEYRLANGLQVLLIPDDSKPTTTVNMTYHVGSRQESYGETGMAHLLEHLMFKGSPKHPQVWAEFNKRGFRANGSTWYDRTNYFASFAANDDNLKWYLSWQADAMVNSFIARKDLDSEMTVVRNEMEMGENDPGRVLMEKTVASMYEWHNYGKSTIGARADVEGVDISHLQAFYRKYYQPDNATLIVSGKFNPTQVLAWVQQYFGVIPKPTRALPQLYTLDPVQDGEHSVIVRRVGGVPLLYAGYHVAPGASPDYAAVEMLSLIFGDEPSGRLHKQLTEKKLAAGVFSFAEGLADPGFMLLGAQLGANQDPTEAAKVLLDTIESVSKEPITQEELDRAKAKWLNDWDAGFTDPQHVGVALSEAVAQGDWRLYFLLRDRIKAITLADVQKVANEIFVPSNRTLGEYIPTAHPVRAPKPERVNVADELKTFKPQVAAAQAEAFDASPANIDARTQRFQLGQGLKVALLPKATRGQAVKATLTLHFGDAKSLANWGSVPAAMAAMLDKGTATLNRQQIQDKLDALQAQLAISSGPGELTVAIATKRDHLPAVIDLVADMLQHPVWPAEALDEIRRQSLASIEEQRKEPEAVLEEALARHDNPYPKGDVRYARTFDELVSDWQAVDLARIKAFHDRFLSAAHAEFASVGDLDPVAVKQALTRSLADWHNAEPYTRVPQPLVPEKAVRMQLATPDKQNAAMTVTLSLPLNDRHPDYAAFMMANYLLGSGGDSRLWNRIREKEGLSYSVYSMVQWNPIEENSQWVASAIFAPQNRAKVEKAFGEVIQSALSQGFTEAEFESGRKGLLSFRQLARAQDGRLAAAWASNLYLDRTFADSARVDAELKALTLDQVNAALRRYLHPEQFVMGVAGDFKDAKP
ncbi:MAG: insulinase family protein [Burkholderiales bacterium]|nr:insulinase family protein [Burkholderiales bacterium]MDE2431780.1 insulinase family protein [Burkholderiales bacterium]